MPGYEVIPIQTSMSMSIQPDIDVSIISNLAPKQAQVLIIAAVFWGISGSYKAILGPKIVELCVILSVVK